MNHYLDPDQIFLDSSNLPSFDQQQFEGQIEKPIAKRSFYIFGLCCLLVALIFLSKVFQLQWLQGEALATRSESNTLAQIPIFAERGTITDRMGTNLAWNDQGRHYITEPGFSHLLGYTSLPKQEELDEHDYYTDEAVGREGVEQIYNNRLRGQPGIKIEERGATGAIASDYLLDPPTPGENLVLSIDARLQEQMAKQIHGLMAEGRFVGGAGVIMDVATGEILALTSAPEYDSNVMATGDDRGKINAYLTDKNHPFLNRVVAGVYTPGSIVKPIMAAAALSEKVITPEKKILSTGQLVVPNPYYPDKPTIFRDWKAHGWVDLRHALAVSSDVYFYEVGGGFGDQKGLGIAKIDDYATRFGLGQTTGSPFLGEEAGVIPTPEWKKANFDGADWLLGNTYHTAIGQYGFQVTPLQMVRAVAAIANGGHLVKPSILAATAGTATDWEPVAGVSADTLQIVREGMHLAVEDGNTAAALRVPGVDVAGKTGTAELGTAKDLVNSWVTGFFPYENPRYAFAMVMEKGSSHNLIGAPYAMGQVLRWIGENAPEYAKS